ncbi:MAG: asparagine synthase C-terminal domain-containing protein, partial [Pseudomonadota bacterium]|nr:asparagine synthase C-terminal domain-containing protein [Pseudomonadota bacterium]
ALFTKDVSAQLNGHLDPSALFRRYDLEAGDASELNQMLYIDMNTYMVDELLVLSDRMSMAHSLELRVPYLDHLLVEHFAKVDPALKLHGFTKKYLLKKIAERYYPKSFIYRKKVGFSTPLVLWLRGELKGYMLHILNRKSVMRTGIINPDAVERYVHDHLGLKRNYDMRLWALMMFMLWYNTYIDKIY